MMLHLKRPDSYSVEERVSGASNEIGWRIWIMVRARHNKWQGERNLIQGDNWSRWRDLIDENCDRGCLWTQNQDLISLSKIEFVYKLEIQILTRVQDFEREKIMIKNIDLIPRKNCHFLKAGSFSYSSFFQKAGSLWRLLSSAAHIMPRHRRLRDSLNYRLIYIFLMCVCVELQYT